LERTAGLRLLAGVTRNFSGDCPETSTAYDPVLSQTIASFRGDARHSGVYQQVGVPLLHRIKWRFKTGAAVISTPAVIDGTVYFGSNDHYLYAVNLADGMQQWKFKTGSRVTSSPAVHNDPVYFGSYDVNIFAVDAKSGEQRWKFVSEGERRFSGRHLHSTDPAGESMPDPFDVYLSSAAIDADTVYVGSGDGNIYALDAASGALRWKLHTGNVVHASPAIANGTVYVGSWDSYFYTIDAKSGQERWRSRRPKTTRSQTRSASSPRRPLPTAWCTSVAAIPICMRSMPLAVRKSGRIPPRALGSFRRPSRKTGHFISPLRIPHCLTQSMPKPAC
jgi:outer membrane protein assembly factor BamB